MNDWQNLHQVRSSVKQIGRNLWSVIHIALARSLAAYINASELLVGSVEGSGQYSMMIKRLLGCAYLKLPGGKYGEFCVRTWMKLSVTGAYKRERKEPR